MKSKRALIITVSILIVLLTGAGVAIGLRYMGAEDSTPAQDSGSDDSNDKSVMTDEDARKALDEGAEALKDSNPEKAIEIFFDVKEKYEQENNQKAIDELNDQISMAEGLAPSEKPTEDIEGGGPGFSGGEGPRR
jgi:flagellar basal body-associated protein FliL